MFSAIQKNGEIFQLFPRRPKNVLEEIRKKEEFYCPECREKVILKLGTKRIEHFAHLKGSHCTESYERESEYHINGKLHLFQRLKEENLNPSLESYDPSIRQRPDVSFTYEGKQFALEFQCSAIPFELMVKRTNNYRKIKISPLWILGGKNINRKGARKVALSYFDYYFAAKHPAGIWYLPAYCPLTKIFILLHHLSPITVKNTFAHLTIIPIQHFTFKHLYLHAKQAPFSSSEWKREMQLQKQNMQLRGKKQYFPLLQELYLSRLNLSLLPPFIGLPVPNAILIETPPLIWQLYFFLDHLWKRSSGDKITVNALFQHYLKRLEQGQVKERKLPLMPRLSPLLPVMEYMEMLEKVQILQRLNANTFQIKQVPEVPAYTGQQLKAEEQFYKQYEEVLFQS